MLNNYLFTIFLSFSAMRELYMKNGEGFVLVYSITSTRSLEDLDPIRQGIVRHKNSQNVKLFYLIYLFLKNTKLYLFIISYMFTGSYGISW